MLTGMLQKGECQMKTQEGVIKWDDEEEPENVLFGIIPDGDFQEPEDDDNIFYWLDKSEQVVGLNISEFTIISLGEETEI